MHTPDSSAEAQLQQELREMFLVDTQQQLEMYFDIIQRLQAGSWIADIQSIYRAIHTIKGGAVTVDANSMLYAAIALEDLLSDLRYLEVAPALSDGKLAKMLLEAGELLASCLEVSSPDNVEDGNRVQLTIQRIETLHGQVKVEYLPEWNEMKQVHQEFAEQGFDLVVLDLEMALGNLLAQGVVSPQLVATAQATIAQLTQIGTELELASGWTLLIELGDRLIINPDSQIWNAVWLPYFHVLKTCVKNSGEIDPSDLAHLNEIVNTIKISAPSSDLPQLANFEIDHSTIESAVDLPDFLDDFFDEEIFGAIDPISGSISTSGALTDDLLTNTDILAVAESLPLAESDQDLSNLLDDFLIDDEIELVAEPAIPSLVNNADITDNLLDDLLIEEDTLPDVEVLTAEIESEQDLPGLLDDFFVDDRVEIITNTAMPVMAIDHSLLSSPAPELDPFNSFDNSELDDFAELDGLDELELISLIESGLDLTIATDAVIAADLAPQPLAPPIASAAVEVKRGISIPVPLERLDRSAQHVVDTLLTARAVTNISNRLQSQLNQLSVLTQESSQFVTRLRQLQDDYALLRNLNDDQDHPGNVTTERYRQGYTTIVRLLENILRMSELGQEIETATYQNHNHLDDLDRSILRLKDGIETSRLVPFKNLTLRAKAILRDLTNRYGKPAELIVQNEQVELDAGIVQQLEPALLHLLRNAYDHGLETVAQRLAAGKPELGIINVSLHRRGNLYRLEVEDDGGGIDPNVIHQIAVSKGFSLNCTQTNSELLNVLCQPGFSSSSSVSEVSGRGVGMDVVVAQIATIGGKLSLETAIGHGTKFTIEVPAPQLLVPCVLFQVGERTVALPTEEVIETALLSSMAAQMSTDDEVGMCAWTLTTSQGMNVPGFDLANYWQFAQRSLPDTAICIRTRQGGTGTEIWSIADDLLGQAELLIKPLPSPLIAPVGLLGVSLQSDGQLISILDPIALTTKLSTHTDRSSDYSFNTLAVERSKPSAPTILIVDDAALMRRRFESSLTTYGFITHTCNDGLEALNWLQNNPVPDLIITDVEMPNMDGFTLIDRCRQAKIDIPILVVSSRLSSEWGKEARRLGATDYLNKGFSTVQLLATVNGLLGVVLEGVT